jgi:hypothetical protein
MIKGHNNIEVSDKMQGHCTTTVDRPTKWSRVFANKIGCVGARPQIRGGHMITEISVNISSSIVTVHTFFMHYV